MGGIKYLRVPKQIVVKDTLGDPSGNTTAKWPAGSDRPLVVSFRQVVCIALEHVDVFRKSAETWRASMKIADWADELREGAVVAIAENHLELLRKAVESRAVFAWPSAYLRQLGPHFAAIEDDAQARDSSEAWEPAQANGVSHGEAAA